MVPESLLSLPLEEIVQGVEAIYQAGLDMQEGKDIFDKLAIGFLSATGLTLSFLLYQVGRAIKDHYRPFNGKSQREDHSTGEELNESSIIDFRKLRSIYFGRQKRPIINPVYVLECTPKGDSPLQQKKYHDKDDLINDLKIAATHETNIYLFPREASHLQLVRNISFVLEAFSGYFDPRELHLTKKPNLFHLHPAQSKYLNE